MTNGRTLNACTGSSSVEETLLAISSNVWVPDLGGQIPCSAGGEALAH